MAFRTLFLLNLIGFLLLGSWLLPATTGYWQLLDDFIFWHTNQYITPEHPLLVWVLSWTNIRAFDTVVFCTMAVLFIGCMLSDYHQPGWLAKWFFCGLIMGIVAGLGGFFIHEYLTYSRPSPTLVYNNVNLLSNLTHLPVKDTAINSFPGDHGFMSMVFSFFIICFSRKPLSIILSLFLTFLITLPRILVGAHWVSDVYMGSLSLMLIVSPWLIKFPTINMLTRKNIK